jgi:hypothetical protein
MDYFSLFFNGELLNNIVIATKSYAIHKISELSEARSFFCSRWSNVSVPELETFLSVIVSMGLIPLPNTIDYKSSE